MWCYIPVTMHDVYAGMRSFGVADPMLHFCPHTCCRFQSLYGYDVCARMRSFGVAESMLHFRPHTCCVYSSSYGVFTQMRSLGVAEPMLHIIYKYTCGVSYMHGQTLLYVLYAAIVTKFTCIHVL